MVVKSTVDLEGRRQALTDLLSASGSLRIEDLAERFKVSTMTVRRDLQALEDEGLARRVRGGAVSGGESFEAREPRSGRAKAQIARKLSDLVPSGGVGICMDASTTISTLAGSMPTAENLSVVTDGIETFLTLSRNPRVHAYLTGGQKDPNAGSLIGPVASCALKQFSFARAPSFLQPPSTHISEPASSAPRNARSRSSWQSCQTTSSWPWTHKSSAPEQRHVASHGTASTCW